MPDKSPKNKPAQLGQPRAQITKELGQPKAHYMNGFNLFHDGGMEVQAHFQGRRADALFYYTFKRKISDPWLSSVLALNSKGTAWVLEAASGSGKKAYHTTDHKYYAFLSEGNQLMIETDAFLHKTPLQPGKAIPVDALPECIFAPDHPVPRIGGAEEIITRIYGQPLAIMKDGAKEYWDGCQVVSVHYKDGLCDKVFYTADNYRNLTDCWKSYLLSMNSNGRAWIVHPNSKLGKMWYHTADGKYHATSDKVGLLVYTDASFREDRKREGKDTPSAVPVAAYFYPCAFVWLGQTEAQMTKQLGQPRSDKKDRVYQNNGVQVRATFDHGICNRIIYCSDNNRKFSEHWVSATLALTSGGRAWLVYENSKPKKIYYSTLDHKFYARLTDGNKLGILTEECCKKASLDKNASNE